MKLTLRQSFLCSRYRRVILHVRFFDPDYNLEGMNETDVRESIVRPLLHELGYRFGTESTIITEKTLRYDKNFLGRKKTTDPVLRGRADFICQVVSRGRWVVEVKASNLELSRDDAEQAHTYAAHPEVAAIYYLLTNGKSFKLYRTSYPDEPILEWSYEETVRRMSTLKNILSPEGITRSSIASQPDVEKPLASGLASKLNLVGEVVTYQDHWSNSPLIEIPDTMKGSRAAVTKGKVERLLDGSIKADLALAGPFDVWDVLNKLAGIEGYSFSTSEEFISTDRSKPTIFQGLVVGHTPKGSVLPPLPGQTTSPQVMPFDSIMRASTEAVGFIEEEKFTSEQFQRLLSDNGITCSMSRAGNVWDNSAMESFFSSLKTERTARKVYRTRDQARADAFDYIERFYNSRRRHSKLGYVSPVEFETRAMLA